MHLQIRHSSSLHYRNIVIKCYRYLKVAIAPLLFHAVAAGESHPKSMHTCIPSNLCPNSYHLYNLHPIAWVTQDSGTEPQHSGPLALCTGASGLFGIPGWKRMVEKLGFNTKSFNSVFLPVWLRYNFLHTHWVVLFRLLWSFKVTLYLVT